MKLQLIQPAVETQSAVGLRGWLQPLGLLHLASAVSERLPSWTVEVLDGTLLSNDEIRSKIGADVVGFYTVMRNYPHALRLAASAKQVSATVLLGGPHATFLPREILSQRMDVDAVIGFDGENALCAFLEGRDPLDISNLAFRDRKSGAIVMNEQEWADINSLPLPHRTAGSCERYFENFRASTHSPFRAGTNIASQRGCQWKARSGGCSFCAIPRGRWRVRDIQGFWREVLCLNQELGVDFFFDVADNIGASTRWLRSVLESRPSALRGVGFRFYISAESLGVESLRLLGELGCCQLFVGFESFVDEQLSAINKRACEVDNIRAMRALAESRMRFVASFITGIAGETEAAAAKTLRYATKLSLLPNCDDIHWSRFKPLPGSNAFRELLLTDPVGEKYRGRDIFSEDELVSDWISLRCQLGRDAVERYATAYAEIRPRTQVWYVPCDPCDEGRAS